KYRPAKFLFVVSLISLLSFSCKKDSGVGSNLLPSNDILSAYVNDTTTVLSSIELKDSVITTDLAYMPVGSYFDPVFGMTKSSIYTQVVLPGNVSSYSFGTGPYTLDSVVLYLPVHSITGNLTPQTFTVDTILDNGALVGSKAYYSDTNVAHGTNHIGMATAAPNAVDSFTYG